MKAGIVDVYQQKRVSTGLSGAVTYLRVGPVPPGLGFSFQMEGGCSSHGDLVRLDGSFFFTRGVFFSSGHVVSEYEIEGEARQLSFNVFWGSFNSRVLGFVGSAR